MGRRVVGLAENGGSSCTGRRVVGLAKSGGCVEGAETDVSSASWDLGEGGCGEGPATGVSSTSTSSPPARQGVGL